MMVPVPFFISIFFFRKVFFTSKTENAFPLRNKTKTRKAPWESKKNPEAVAAPGFPVLVHEVGLEPRQKHLSALQPQASGFIREHFREHF